MNSDGTRANCDDTSVLSELNSYSDCTSFYSDCTPVQSDSLTADLDHANADSDYERVNSMHTIFYFDYTRLYSEEVSKGFTASLNHSDYPITNLLTFTVGYTEHAF